MWQEFTILVADPYPYVRTFLTRELIHAGYQVVEAGTSSEIFKLIQAEQTPDLIVFELNMPKNSGFEILDRLRNTVPPIPVIIYSNLTEYENHPDVQWVDAFLEKDGDLKSLLNTVSEVIFKYYKHCF
jgi:CheY-like chemotaxis protein